MFTRNRRTLSKDSNHQTTPKIILIHTLKKYTKTVVNFTIIKTEKKTNIQVNVT